MSTALPPRGRGTATNLHNRFAPTVSVAEDDGWYQEVPETQGTEVRIETAKTIITRNNSPDLPFDRSINPYRGCEHGWPYSTIRTDTNQSTVAWGKLSSKITNPLFPNVVNREISTRWGALEATPDSERVESPKRLRGLKTAYK